MKKWTKREISILWEMAGSKPLFAIANRLNRTPISVSNKAKRENICLFQGTHTISNLCVLLKTTPSVIWRICKHLKLRIKRRNYEGGGYFMVSEEQAWKIMKAYKEEKNKWAAKHKACKICGRTNRRHSAHGLCVRCYERDRIYNSNKYLWHERLRALTSQIMDGFESGLWKNGLIEITPNSIKAKMETKDYETEVEIEKKEKG